MARTVQREILPIPDQPYQGVRPYTASDPAAKYPPIEPLRPPKGAPNVLVILIDDAGFGASSAFGGVINTPNAERLASEGLRYTRFHTTALCSPTRAALLTGRNHHYVGMGGITEATTSAPGYTGVRPNYCAPLAEMLKLNGYSTAQFGKAHETPNWETSPVGPFDRWPTGSGFEYFYGFLGGDTNQWYPALYENTSPIDPPATPEEGYHLMPDLADRAIGWIHQQKALVPDKPFFVYFAPGATHAPHHVPKEWADKYKGQFDDGWDKLREKIFARQKQLGVIPKTATLTPRPDEIPAWDTIDAKLKPVLVRQMEIYAGFLEFADHHIGRLLDDLAKIEVLRDTLVYLIIGDNGASAEGGLHGTLNEGYMFNGAQDLDAPEVMIANIDKLGGVDAFNHYAVGWAHALDTPYQWTKQIASHFGGTRTGCIVHWPLGIKAKGEMRTQFAHVIDVAPTIMEAAKLPEPRHVNGVQQTPFQGVSMAYSFDDPTAAERHETQYFEIAGNRGIYHHGWTAVTKHATPWVTENVTITLDQDVWELYETGQDWTQAHDLAKQEPQRLAELQRLFLIEATKYYCLPLDDRRVERFNAELAGRPELIKGDTQVLASNMKRLQENSVIVLKNKSHTITAQVELPPGKPGEGNIVEQGGKFGGWSLFMKDGRPMYCYNFLGAKRFTIAGASVVPPGKHQIRMEFTYDGGGVGKGGTAILLVDGGEVGRGRVDRTIPNAFSLDETTDVGRFAGTPVTPDEASTPNGVFSGRVDWVELHAGADSQDHLVDPKELLHIMMARQ
jgi:arylsulfatase A-like enzyme